MSESNDALYPEWDDEAEAIRLVEEYEAYIEYLEKLGRDDWSGAL